METAGELSEVVEDDETVRFEAPTRRDGRVGVTDRRLLVSTSDQPVSIPLENVNEVVADDFNWFLAIMSLALAAFGLYSTQMNVLLGSAFAGFGLASLYLTYRKRKRVQITVHSGHKPVSFFLDGDDYGAFFAAMETALAEFEAGMVE